jgi:tRNA nucleotidyltransferase (CCA-adding enzyme)
VLLSQKRDMVRPGLGDWDLATDATPREVKRLFSRVVPTGIKHGTVTVIVDKVPYEVTTLRGEMGYSDGRRPDSVYFVDDIKDDLARRDFTINAIAYDIEADRLIDPFGGVADLKLGILRAVGVARERFEEDGLRVLRAARFVATLEFDLEPETAEAIAPSLHSYRKVSLERVRDEWLKALASRVPSRAFRVMLQHGILRETAPELASAPLLDFALRVVDVAEDSTVRLAALMHALGQDGALESSPTAADSSAQQAADLLKRLRFSNRERDEVRALIQARVYLLAMPEDRPSQIRLLRALGRLPLARFLQFGRALSLVAGSRVDPAKLQTFERGLLELAASHPPLRLSDLCLSGGDLKATLGLAAGPALGELLRDLLERVTEEPEKNTPEALLELARSLARDR